MVNVKEVNEIEIPLLTSAQNGLRIEKLEKVSVRASIGSVVSGKNWEKTEEV